MLDRCACQLVLGVAALNGDVELLAWILPQAEDMLQVSATELALHLAVKHGNLAIVKWLGGQEHAAWTRPFLCVTAAEGGSLEIMTYLRSREVPCPWNLAASQAAARRPGNAPLLRWMAAQIPPCPMNQQTFSLAVKYGDDNMMLWALEEEHELQPSIPPGCSSCRLLHLAAAGWVVPELLQESLLLARKRYCAFYGSARWHGRRNGIKAAQRQARTVTSLGHLPDEIIHSIACLADIDTSVTLPRL
ncbi:hypothetical protein WJX84_000618 [Apatococcus fuscideae]